MCRLQHYLFFECFLAHFRSDSTSTHGIRHRIRSNRIQNDVKDHTTVSQHARRALGMAWSLQWTWCTSCNLFDTTPLHARALRVCSVAESFNDDKN